MEQEQFDCFPLPEKIEDETSVILKRDLIGIIHTENSVSIDSLKINDSHLPSGEGSAKQTDEISQPKELIPAGNGNHPGAGFGSSTTVEVAQDPSGATGIRSKLKNAIKQNATKLGSTCDGSSSKCLKTFNCSE